MLKYLGRARSRKNYREKFFQPLGPQFGLNIRGGVRAPRAPPPDPPLSSMFKYLTPSVCMKIGHITHGETLT